MGSSPLASFSSSTSPSPRVPFLNSRTPLPRPLASSGMRFAPKSKRMMTRAMISSVPPSEPKPGILPPNESSSGRHATLYDLRFGSGWRLPPGGGLAAAFEQRRDAVLDGLRLLALRIQVEVAVVVLYGLGGLAAPVVGLPGEEERSEEHTSELQSRQYI